MIQNGVENNANPCKFELQGWFGGPGRLPWRQDVPRCDLRCVWGSISKDLGSHLGAKMDQESAKMGQVGAKLAPKMGQLGMKMACLGHFSSSWGLILGDMAKV